MKLEDEEEETKFKIKQQLKSEKREQTMKSEARTQAKLEIKSEAISNVAALLKRGLKLRALADRLKKEKVPLKRVKAEKGQKKSVKRVKKKGSAACRNASRVSMNREVRLSRELSEVVGAPALSRPEAVKRLWAYCRERGMLNPDDKREIIFDNALKKMLGKPRARMYDLSSLLVPHLDYTSPPVPKSEVNSKIKTQVKRKHEEATTRGSKVEVNLKHEETTTRGSKVECPAKHEPEFVGRIAKHET